VTDHDRDEATVPGLKGLPMEVEPARDLWPEIKACIAEKERALKDLPMEAQPKRDLWPGIAARIAVRRNRQRGVWLAAAACTLMAFSAMLSLRVAEEPAAPAHLPLVAPPEIAAMTLPSSGLRQSRQLVKANLKLTQSAESQVLAAMRQQPDNPSLQSLLESTRAQKRELSEMLLADRN